MRSRRTAPPNRSRASLSSSKSLANWLCLAATWSLLLKASTLNASFSFSSWPTFSVALRSAERRKCSASRALESGNLAAQVSCLAL